MKITLVLTLVCLLTVCTSCSSWPEYDGYVGQEHLLRNNEIVRIYDESGNFIGSIDERSKYVYDRNGNFIGRIQK